MCLYDNRTDHTSLSYHDLHVCIIIFPRPSGWSLNLRVFWLIISCSRLNFSSCMAVHPALIKMSVTVFIMHHTKLGLKLPANNHRFTIFYLDLNIWQKNKKPFIYLLQDRTDRKMCCKYFSTFACVQRCGQM